MLDEARPAVPMNAILSLSFGARRRGAPGARFACSIKFAAAKPAAALVELPRNCRRVIGRWMVLIVFHFKFSLVILLRRGWLASGRLYKYFHPSSQRSRAPERAHRPTDRLRRQ